MIDEKIIRARVEIRRLSVADGGRDGALQGTFRPNHNFSGPDGSDLALGSVTLPVGKVLHPGENTEAEITFIASPTVAAEIRPGREWRIQEGRKLLAIGKILEILPLAAET
jgi:elongation factor Tu